MVHRASCYAIVGLLLAGCAAAPPSIEYVTKPVYITVAAPCPPPPQFKAHHLPVADLKAGDAQTSPAKVWGAAEETIRILRAEVDERDKALEAYRTQPTVAAAKPAN